MSHFTVLVVGEDPEKQLEPFQEFECTGEDGYWVKDIDITEKCRKEFNEKTETRYQDPEGKLHDPYQDRFYRDPTEEETEKIGPFGGTGCGGGITFSSRDWGDGRGYRPKVHFLPEGWQEIEVPTFETQSFVQWVEDYYGIKSVPSGENPRTYDEHKFGYSLLDTKGQVIKVIDRTNDRARWDWYQLGGRWVGFFKLRSQVACPAMAQVGEFSLVSDERAKPGWVDQAAKRDIDFEAMAADGARRFGEYWDKIHAIIDRHPPVIPWKQLLADAGIPDGPKTKEDGERLDAACKAYHEQPALLALDRAKEFVWSLEDLLVPREAYCARGARGSCRTHAVLKDGQWYENGEMGWWGAVHNEKEEGCWEAEYQKLLQELPEDTLLSVYDCHI